jgi:pyruvate,water dikinase
MSILSPIVWLSDPDIESEKLGRQSRHLAQLTQEKFPLLPGFVVTSSAYVNFLQENNLDHKIKQLLSTVSFELPDSLMQAEHHIKKLFSQSKLSPHFVDQLTSYYYHLGGETVTIMLYESDHHGRKQIAKQAAASDELIKHIIEAWAEMFAAHALWHRHQLQRDHLMTGAEIIVQKIINGDKKGVVITLDPHTHEKDKLTIITHHPHEDDRYILSKKNLTIIDRMLRRQSTTAKLSLDEILAIGKMANDIERHLYFPQEITWIFDDKTLYIIDIKGFSNLPKQISQKKAKLPIARGKGITHKIGTGAIKIIRTPSDLLHVRSSDILMMTTVDKSHLKQLKKARAVIFTSAHPQKQMIHLLKYSGIPTIFIANYPPSLFRNGLHITINGGKGEIYQGGFF